jgi:transcriptional regulator with XRE-family HTH domain
MSDGRGMNFQELRQRLIVELRERVRSGEVTERGLARMIGLSQPHMHNVLKGKRLFSLETTDEILRQLGLEVLDLIKPGELLDWHRH